MRVFVDSGVILDAFNREATHCDKAKLLLMLGFASEVDLWMSAIQLKDITKEIEKSGRNIFGYLRELYRGVKIAPISPKEIESAISREWPTFDSAVVFESARSIRADAIVTNSINDFDASTIPVFTCNQFSAHLQESCLLPKTY
jgi:hypothetical protein